MPPPAAPHFVSVVMVVAAVGSPCAEKDFNKMSVQINMLKEVGFKSVDIYYKYYNYVVFRARK